MIIIMGIAIAALCCVIFSKSKTKSDCDKHIEDDEQMEYLKRNNHRRVYHASENFRSK